MIAKLMFSIDESVRLKETFLVESLDSIVSIGNNISRCLKDGGRLLICGNGGSAADAQHLAAELSGRFVKERKPLAAIALTTDTSAITAIGNDYSFDDIFSRQVEAIGRQNDILMVFSTSGNSKNIIKAVDTANSLDLTTIGLLGKGGGHLRHSCHYSLIVPSNNTARIQEIHTMIYHFLCEVIDNHF